MAFNPFENNNTTGFNPFDESADLPNKNENPSSAPAGNWGAQSYDSALAFDTTDSVANAQDNMPSSNDGLFAKSLKYGVGRLLADDDKALIMAGKPAHISDEEWMANTPEWRKTMHSYGEQLKKDNEVQTEPWTTDWAIQGVGQMAPEMVGLAGASMAALRGAPSALQARMGAYNAAIRSGLGDKAATLAGEVAASAAISPAQAIPEAEIEANDAYNEALKDGRSQEEADSVKDYVRKANVAMLSGSDTAQNLLALGKIPYLPKSVAGKLAMQAGKLGLNMGFEGAEEGAQEIIPSVAMGEDYNPENVKQAAALGAIGGGVFHVAGRGLSKAAEGGFNPFADREQIQDQNQVQSEPPFESQLQSQPQGLNTQSDDPYVPMAQQVSTKTGIPADLIYGQLYHESGGFNSQLSRENNNFAGLTQEEPNGEDNKQPDGGNYYRKFDSPEQFADSFANYLLRYKEDGILDAQTPEEYAAALKHGGYYTDSVDNYVAGIKSGMENFGASGVPGARYGNRNTASSTQYTETPLPTFTPEEQQQAVTWLEERRDTSDDENEINNIDKQLTEKKPWELLNEYKEKDENGQEVTLGQKLFSEKYQQQEQPTAAKPESTELPPAEQEYIKQVIQQEMANSKDTEWKGFLSTVAKGNNTVLSDFANNYAIGGNKLIDLARQAGFKQVQQNFNKTQQVVNNAKIGVQNLNTPIVQPFRQPEQIGQARDLTAILNAIATQKYDRAEQGLSPIPNRAEPVKAQTVVSPFETQERLNQLTGQQPAQIIMPTRSNQAGQQAIDEIRQSVAPVINTLPTTEQLMTRRELQRALSRKDYIRAIDLANQLGMSRHAEIYGNLANRVGSNVRQHITADDIRRSVAYDKLNDMEKLFVDVLEYFKVSADQVESTINKEYNGIIKGYEAVLKSQVKQPGIKATGKNDSGDKYSRTYSSNFKWFMDLAKQRGYSANKLPQKVITEAIPQIAVEHLKNGYTDPNYGEFVNDDMRQQFSDMEAALNGITSVREKISGAVPAALREPATGSESSDRSVQAAKQAIPIAREFGREQPVEQPTEEVKPELSPIEQKQVEGALKSPGLKSIADKVRQGDVKAKEQFDKLPEHIRSALTERGKAVNVSQPAVSENTQQLETYQPEQEKTQQQGTNTQKTKAKLPMLRVLRERGFTDNPSAKNNEIIRQALMDGALTENMYKSRREFPADRIRAVADELKNHAERNQDSANTEKKEVRSNQEQSGRSFDASKEQTLKEKLLAKRKPKKLVNVFDDSDVALDQALKDLRGELNNLSANPMFNPKLMEAALRVGGIYAQRGVNNFADWSGKIVDAVGEKVRPYLPSTWEMLNNFPESEKYDQETVNTLFEYAGIQYENGYQEENDFTDRITSELGDEFEPFIRMAYSGISKWKGEPQDAKRAGSVVESNSKGQQASDRMGQEILPHGSDGTSGSNRQGSDTARTAGSKQRGSKRLSDVRSNDSGTASNTGVREEESGDTERTAGSEQLPRSGNNSIERVSSDPTATAGVIESASDRQDAATKHVKQKKAGNKSVEVANLDNIRETLPFLMPEQQEDVHFIEQRYSIPDGYGALITNGTGTGKTYSGLGVVKRFAMQGKDNILIVVPSDKIANDWVKSAKNLDLTISQLENIKDSGKGIVVTTFANYGQNSALVKRNWDMLVHDESHYLSSNEKGDTTGALKALRKLTYHQNGLYERFNDVEQKLVNDVKEAYSAIEEARKSDDERQRQSVDDLEKKHTELARKMEARRDELTSKWKAIKPEDKPRVLFLSATPFAYVKNIDYAAGYLFNYADKEGQGYNDTDGYEQFFVEHFGYRMRYNKLTLPDAEVNNSLMEREFHEWLRKQGALSGRVLTVDKDYDRHFVLVDDAIGAKLDEGLKWLNDEADGRYRPLYDVIMANFKYHNRMYLLESIKAKHAVNLAKDYLDQGKKVVVFHDFNKGGGFHPFLLDAGTLSSAEQLITNGSKEATSLKDLYREFKSKRPDLIGMDFSDLKSPIATFRETFGENALLFNGTIPKKTRLTNVDEFNDDNSGKDLILVQSDAGREGISLHDRTGEHQRVLINLGMPVKPTAAIQIEGRIYRVGQASDAMFRYLNTGTTFEQHTFASKIAERASTAENLALGEDARALKESFVDAFEESGDYSPGMDYEGKGGKEQDKAKREQLTPFQKAISYYFGQQKKTSKNKAREGQDYFATPEPVGLKMVEWANLANNEKALEPSAGHGAISRFFNETADNVIIEPSYELAPRATMVSSAKLVNQRFEDYYIGNKFHGVIMNPPYGHGGKTAIEHVAKAAKHLYDGGRVVALIPDGGMADKYFTKWYESDDAKGSYMVGEVKLPGITFNRAGTAVRTRIVVLEKQTDSDTAARINQRSTIDLSGIDDINELFERIENISMPEREKGNDSEQEQATPKEEQTNEAYSLTQFDHTKTGEPIYIAKPNKHLGDIYTDVLQLAKKFKGWYNKFGSKDQKGFAFKTEEDRQAFLNEITDIKYSAGQNTPPDSAIEQALEIHLVPASKLKPNEIALSELGAQLGVPVRFFVAKREFRGFHIDGITYINRNGDREIEWAFWHEGLHWMKQQDPALYQDLYDTINDTFATTPEQIAAYRATIKQGELISENGEYLLSDVDIIEEMFGDEMADTAKRQKWLNQLAQQDKGLFDRFVDFLKEIMANIKARIADDGVGQYSGFSPEQVKEVEKSLRNVLLSLKDAAGQRVINDRMEFPYRELKPEAVQYSAEKENHTGANKSVDDFITESIKSKNMHQDMMLRTVSEDEAQRIKDKTGYDVRGYSHYLSSDDLRHILNQHGTESEKHDNQIPLTADDLTHIPEILDNPQQITKGNPTKREGLPTVRFIKPDESGAYVVVEAIRERGKKMVVKTMWKKSVARHRASNADPLHTSTSAVNAITPGGNQTSSITSIVPQEQRDVKKDEIKYSASFESDENSVQQATKNFAINFGIKPAENITVVGRPVVSEPGFVGRYLQSVKPLAEKYPKLMPFFRLASNAMEKQENLRNDFRHRLDKVEKILGSKGKEYKDNKESLLKILLDGDASQHNYNTQELKDAGYNSNVIKAYHAIRIAYKHAYKLANEVRQGIETKSENMNVAKLADLQNNQFTEVLSVTDKGQGQYLVTWKQPKITEHVVTVTKSELEAIRQDPNVQIIKERLETGTTHAMPESSGLTRGDDWYEVEYRSQTPPIANRDGYMPHFFHDWFVMAKTDDSTEMLYSARTMREAVQYANKYVKDNPDAEIVVKPKQFKFPGADVNAAVMGDMDYFKMTQKVSDDLEISLDDAKEWLDGKVHMKSRHRFVGNFLQRKGANGWEQDLDWVNRHYFNMVSRYVALDSFKSKSISTFERLFGQYDKEYQGVGKYVKEYINDVNGVPTELENAINNSLNGNKYFNKFLGTFFGERPALQLATNITNAVAVLKLGMLNVSSGMLQLTQFINVASAMDSYEHAWQGLAASIKPSLADSRVLAAAGVDANLSMETAGYSKAGQMGKAFQWSTIIFRYGDLLMRRTAVLGAYRKSIAEGKSRKEAIEYAKDINRKANFEYGVNDAPNIFRRGGPVSQVLLQFKKYPIKQMELMVDIAKHGDIGQNAKFWAPYMLLSGIWGIPLLGVFKEVFGWFGWDWDDEAKKAMFEWAGNDKFYQTLVKTAWYGLLSNTAYGIDVSKRTGIGDAVPTSVKDLAGPVIGTIYQTAKEISRGNGFEAIKAISPGIGNVLVAAAGEIHGDRGRVKTKYEEVYERVQKGLGFMPVSESISRDKNWLEKKMNSERRDEVAEAIDNYLEAEGNKDAKAKQAAMKDLQRLRVSPRQVANERMQKNRTEIERTEKATPKKYRKEFTEIQQFK